MIVILGFLDSDGSFDQVCARLDDIGYICEVFVLMTAVVIF